MSATSRLAIVLADVFIPADAAVPNAGITSVGAPLGRILRFANAAPIEDWRSWVNEQWRLDSPRGWRATPVQLEARLDHVRLGERGILHLDAEPMRELAADFNATFAPQWSLGVSPRGDYELLGHVHDDSDVATTDPAQLLGMDMHAGLARGRAAQAVRALGAEIEMWLHAHRLNEVRRRARLPEVSTLWLWRSLDLGALEHSPAGDFHALRQSHDSRSLVVVLWPLTRSSLDRVEQDWLAPALASVAAGELATLELIANNQVWTLRRRDLWKRWRRSRGWVDALRGHGTSANQR